MNILKIKCLNKMLTIKKAKILLYSNKAQKKL